MASKHIHVPLTVEWVSKEFLYLFSSLHKQHAVYTTPSLFSPQLCILEFILLLIFFFMVAQ